MKLFPPCADMLTCKQLKKRADNWLSYAFIGYLLVVGLPFLIYSFMLFLSLGLMNWYFLDEVWYRPLLLGCGVMICYKKDERFCYAAAGLSFLLLFLRFQDVPFGMETRGLIFVLTLVTGIMGFWAIRVDKQLSEHPAYPYFIERAEINPNAVPLAVVAAKQEREAAPAVYSNAPQQEYMDALVVPTFDEPQGKEGLLNDEQFKA